MSMKNLFFNTYYIYLLLRKDTHLPVLKLIDRSIKLHNFCNTSYKYFSCDNNMFSFLHKFTGTNHAHAQRRLQLAAKYTPQ